MREPIIDRNLGNPHIFRFIRNSYLILVAEIGGVLGMTLGVSLLDVKSLLQNIITFYRKYSNFRK